MKRVIVITVLSALFGSISLLAQHSAIESTFKDERDYLPGV